MWPMLRSGTLHPRTREKGRRHRATNLFSVVDVTVSERVSVSDAGLFCLGERCHGGLELGDVRVPRSVKTSRCASHRFKLVFKLVLVSGQCPMYKGQCRAVNSITTTSVCSSKEGLDQTTTIDTAISGRTHTLTPTFDSSPEVNG